MSVVSYLVLAVLSAWCPDRSREAAQMFFPWSKSILALVLTSPLITAVKTHQNDVCFSRYTRLCQSKPMFCFFLSGEKSELTLVNTFINNVIFSIRLVFFFPLLELYVTGVDRLERGLARKHADKQGGRH